MLGWLSPADQRAELMRMIGEQLAGDAVSSADVDLVCDLNKDGELDQERHRLHVSPAQADKVPHAAVLACLGAPTRTRRVLRALTSPNDEEVRDRADLSAPSAARRCGRVSRRRDGDRAYERFRCAGSRARHAGAESAPDRDESGRADALVPARQVRQRPEGRSPES